MKRLTLWMLTLFLLTISLTGGVVAYARAQSTQNPVSELGLALCNRIPCYMGIRPGITTWNEAKALLKSEGALETIQFDKVNALYISKAAGVEVISSEDGGMVFEVRILADFKTEALGHLIQTLGSPCSVSERDMTTTIYVNYPDLYAEVFVERERLESGSRLYRIKLVQSGSSDLCSGSTDARLYRWLGLSSMRHYAHNGFPTH